MLIEIHMLKNYPPVNLNRDDSGAPKSCFFGGVQRGRISSQCLKRSWRKSECFKELGEEGIRTNDMPNYVGEQLILRGIEQKLANAATKKLTQIAKKEDKENESQEDPDKSKGKTQTIFYTNEEIAFLIDRIEKMIVQDGNLNNFSIIFQQLEKEKKRPLTVDMALFGRMVTSKYFDNVEASMQVAHAISTHMVNRESDYFTAIDDLTNQASMLDETNYSSCCYYEYAALDTDILRENLKYRTDRDALMKKLVPVLLKAMAHTNPSGKQKSFAGNIFPDMIMVELKKEKIALSYVNAFEEPVTCWSAKGGLVQKSLEKLVNHIDCMDRAFQLQVIHRAFFTERFDGIHPHNCEIFDDLPSLAHACAEWMQEVENA
ncbi:MAG: type I-E CRISPR-associated protein Cas7/Cse4/CasC [Clostridia bacterium]|nr:type I-E CRISPR-associated protein Cas7/Cse4/CasC [Clostridia bacterium]